MFILDLDLQNAGRLAGGRVGASVRIGCHPALVWNSRVTPRLAGCLHILPACSCTYVYTTG